MLVIVPVMKIVEYLESSMSIVWTGINLLKQHIAFLLQEWWSNGLNNILDIHDSVQHSLHKYNIVTHDTSHHDARG